MFEIIRFIVDNWNYFSTLFICFIVFVFFILLLIFRRSKSVLIDEGLYCEVLMLVIEAEKLFGSGHGKEKLEYVITKVMNKHPSWLSCFDGFQKTIEKVVDDVLTSPQKKEN